MPKKAQSLKDDVPSRHSNNFLIKKVISYIEMGIARESIRVYLLISSLSHFNHFK